MGEPVTSGGREGTDGNRNVRGRKRLPPALGIFLALGILCLVGFRFYVYRPLPRFATPLDLPPGTLGGAGSRLLVFAPHSDDETLGAGGVIRDTVAAGGQVRVVLLTNGDGFTFAAEEELRTGRLTAEQYIELGYIRQNETLAAMSVLGLGSQDVLFLGYPDRGLTPMWEQYWGQDTLFVSRYTKIDHSPYKNGYEPGAPYCGEDAAASISRIIAEFRPTQIIVTHPNDAHPDHWATFALVTYALEQLRGAGFDPERQVAVYTYLVHRGDWPLPRGYHPSETLDPPRTLAVLTTRWYRYPLDPKTIAAERDAVNAYHSQTTLMPFFLRSFIRKNELFGIVPVAQVAAATTPGAAPAILDPLDDTVARRAEPGADLQAIYAAAAEGYLRLLARPRGTPSPRVNYVYLVSDFGPGGRRSFYRFSVTPPGEVCTQVNGAADSLAAAKVQAASSVQVVDGGIELTVGLAALGSSPELFLAVQTEVDGTTIDRTEWTVLKLP